jgi:hypothetical protein
LVVGGVVIAGARVEVGPRLREIPVGVVARGSVGRRVAGQS